MLIHTAQLQTAAGPRLIAATTSEEISSGGFYYLRDGGDHDEVRRFDVRIGSEPLVTAPQPDDRTGLTPVKFEIQGTRSSDGRDPRYVESREQRDGSRLWVVTGSGSFVLARDGIWEWEPQPSSRDDEFITRTRFASAAEAASFFHSSDPKLPSTKSPKVLDNT